MVEERISCLSGGIIKWLISCRPPRCLQKAAPRCSEISSEVCVHVLANDKYGCVCISHGKRNSGKQPDIPVQLIHACASLRVCVGGGGGNQPSHVHSCCCCCCNRVNMLNETQSELYFSTFPVLSPHSLTSCPENRLENPPQVLLCSDRDPFNHRSGYTNISAFSKITPLLPRSRMLH